MHKYLRAIGFSQLKDNREAELLLRKALADQYLTAAYELEDGRRIEQYQLPVAPGMGIAVAGERQEDGSFVREYYFPYMKSYDETLTEDWSIERHTEKETCSGTLEDFRAGIALIFYLCNTVEYRGLKQQHKPFRIKRSFLTGLAVEGKILFPIEKHEEDEERSVRRDMEQRALIEAAQHGDQEAIETLTKTDMDMFSRIAKRMENEDLYSVVDTSFMPTGVECDQYQIIGEICSFRVKSNVYTDEKVLDLSVKCNDSLFHVCINEADLLGVPAVGRRFKGRIWMQGEMEFLTGRA